MTTTEADEVADTMIEEAVEIDMEVEAAETDTGAGTTDEVVDIMIEGESEAGAMIDEEEDTKVKKILTN